MPALSSQSDFRKVQELPFCYLCGLSFDDRSGLSRDHVPPKAIFGREDRTPPLILPVHKACNQAQAERDKVIGQLLSVQHGRIPTQRDLHLQVHLTQPAELGPPMALLTGINLHATIARWIRGFHAALYCQPLPNDTPNNIHSPFPELKQSGSSYVSAPILGQQRVFVEVIKQNRVANRLDCISCYNRKCVYECVWEQMDNQAWACFFAIQIYNWRTLGEQYYAEPRGCVGWYLPHAGLPPKATCGISKNEPAIPFANVEPLDPFGA